MTVRTPIQGLVFAAVCGAAVYLAAQTPTTPQAPAPAASTAKTIGLNQPVPTDPQITVGKFPNGLRYYLKTNRKPEKRAELRLVVNAGSVLEDDNQKGLAHFVEHMAFNGTKHYPRQQIIAFMQSIGMQFGPSINAFTTFDETVYQLQIPTDRPDIMDKAMLILEDWAHNVVFDPTVIDKERQVITEEWRRGRGAAARMSDKQFPVLLAGSRYAERLPIGDTDNIAKFDPALLKKFYNDWYRPDLMAVVAVGDFDKAAVEPLVRKHFAAMENPPNPRPRPTYNVPDHAGTLYTIATDKEAAATSVRVYDMEPAPDQRTVGAYRDQIVETLYYGMLSGRYSEMSQKPDAPFIAAGAGNGLFVRTREATTLTAVVNEHGIERGLDALFTETDRVARFGFTATELTRQKQLLQRAFERAVTEKDQQESKAFAEEFIRNFTTGEPIPGIVYESQLHQRFLPEIALAEVNKLARNWSSDKNRVVVVNAPEKPGLTVPDATKLAAVIKAASAKNLTAYVDAVTTAPLVETPPTPGTVARTATKDAYGITEWELSNGVKVILKPTSFKDDEIVFRAFSPGGTSLASDADYIPAQTAMQVVSAGGLGKFNAVDLRKQLTGKVANVRPIVGETEEGLTGNGSPKDIETLFQLIYLTFTAPRADAEAFKVLTSQTKALIGTQQAQPGFAFAEALTSALTQNHLRARPLTADRIDEMNLDKSLAFYRDRFADASDFTFVFVGSMDLAAMKPLAERYLGSLPSLHRKETWKDVGMRAPTGVVEKRVEKGLEPKSEAAIIFNGPFQFDQPHRVALHAATLVLEGRLREALREQLGGTYSVTANDNSSKTPIEQYTVVIDFGCDPDRTNDLVKRVFQEVDAVKASGVSDAQLRDVRAGLIREFETRSKTNAYLLGQLVTRYQVGEDLKDFLNLPALYNALTPAMVQEAAKTYFNTSNYVEVTLFPEKKLSGTGR
ncbi:MAG TPA: insulinase family protein [Vicinamibacterales bacterium]|nr:insulinase family protein [Vicinamibacterales bacterium]